MTDDRPGNAERIAGEELADLVREAVDASGLEPGLGQLQLAMLQAIYHELRHGHDQAARQAEAMSDLVDAMDTLGRRMLRASE